MKYKISFTVTSDNEDDLKSAISSFSKIWAVYASGIVSINVTEWERIPDGKELGL